VLRLGGLGTEELELALPGPWLTELDARIAPGQLPSHYAPRAEVHLVEANELEGLVEHLRSRGRRIATLVPEGARAPASLELLRILPRDPAGYARHLYASLRELDTEAPELILVVLPEERGIGRAVADRLRRAAAPRPGEIGAGSDEIREPRAQNSR
jgi:L-threonylcarbamoyladenylate synthase